MPARYYYLGPWQETVEPGRTVVFNGQVLTSSDITVLTPPDGTVGLVDLRPPRGQGGYGFFATDRPLGSDYEPFGDGINRLEDVTLAAQRRTKWASMLGMSNVG